MTVLGGKHTRNDQFKHNIAAINTPNMRVSIIGMHFELLFCSYTSTMRSTTTEWSLLRGLPLFDKVSLE